MPDKVREKRRKYRLDHKDAEYKHKKGEGV